MGGTVGQPVVAAQAPTFKQTGANENQFQNLFNAVPTIGGKGTSAINTKFVPAGMNTVAQQVAAAPVGALYSSSANGGSGGFVNNGYTDTGFYSGTPNGIFGTTNMAPVTDLSTGGSTYGSSDPGPSGTGNSGNSGEG